MDGVHFFHSDFGNGSPDSERCPGFLAMAPRKHNPFEGALPLFSISLLQPFPNANAGTGFDLFDYFFLYHISGISVPRGPFLVKKSRLIIGDQ